MKKLSILFSSLCLSLLATTFVSCGDDDTKPEPDPMTIAEIAAADTQFSTLVGALERVGLVSVLDGTGNFTVFAPTNAAFSGVDLADFSDDELKEILLYHVLGGKVASTDLQEGQTYATTASENGPGGEQLSVLIEKTGSTVKVNNVATVTTADVAASNGVIHIVNAIILPLDVVGHAAANSNFSSLVATLGAASGDLVSVLSGNGPFTVFAPVNAAFDEIEAVTATLDADQLAKVLTYHVVGGNVLSGDLNNGMMATTVNGENITVNIAGNGDVTVTDAGGNVSNVVLTDVQATNGVIHVLDKVLIPNDL